jgi:hypothetical protein
MEGQVPGDPGELRISDDDRHRVAEVLRLAAGEGRIDLTELDERLEATYSAKTYRDLVPITVDLPAPQAHVEPQRRPVPAPVPTPADRAGRRSSSLALMSETSRTGPWVLEDGHVAFALMGSVLLDLREASFSATEVVLNAHAVMGQVTVVVDARTTVVLEGSGVMGEYAELRPRVDADPQPGGPVVRVRGFALMGAVHVVRKDPPQVRGGDRPPRLG